MTSPKSLLAVLVLTLAVVTAAATGPSFPDLTGAAAPTSLPAVVDKLRPALKTIKYIFTPHAKAVATVCRNSFQENRRLCLKTLRRVPSEDPLDLVKGSLTAGNEGVKKAIAYLDSLRPRYKAGDMGITYIESCQHYLNYALDSYQEVWDAIGKDWGSLCRNYQSAVSSIDSAYSYHSTCLDDIEDEETSDLFTKGMDVSKNLTSTAQGLMRNMDGVIAGFGLRLPLPPIAKPLNEEQSV